MKILEPGHIYEIPHNDAPGSQILIFVNTHEGQEHPGAISQEVLRVLIDRLKFKDADVPCLENGDMLYFARMWLFTYEARAYRRKVAKLNGTELEHDEGRERYKDVPFDELGWFDGPRNGIENIPVGPDGHIAIPPSAE